MLCAFSALSAFKENGEAMTEKIEIKLSFTGVIDIKNAENNSIIKVNKGSSVSDVLGGLGVKHHHKKYI